MSKCFQCIKDEYHRKIKWSAVMDAVVILDGTGYCYEHLKKELEWKDDLSTKNEVSNTLYKEEPKVDNIKDIHSQIKKEIDKDYWKGWNDAKKDTLFVKDKLNAQESK